MAACAALAFDSAEWLEKRELLTQEAERLRAAYKDCEKKATEPAEDVTIPVDTFPDGSVKLTIHAEKAQYFHSKGLVWAENLKVLKFDRDGEEDSRVEAKHCLFDKETKSGWAEGPTKFTHGKTTFRGNGVYFSSPEGYVMVLEDADIESKDLKFGGARP